MIRGLRRCCRSIGAAALVAAVAAAGLSVAAPAQAEDINGRIFYVGAGAVRHIWSMAPDGSDEVQLTDEAVSDDDPAPSPNGHRVAFVRDVGGHTEIFVMDEDGTDQTQLTDTGSGASQPSWSPDGTQIVFVTGTSDDIWVVPSDGGAAMPLRESEENESTPVFSPDGTQVAFSANNRIQVMDAEQGATATPITDGGSDTAPAYLPDGRIVFQRANDIWVVDPSQTPPTESALVNDPLTFDWHPAPSPDGTKITYTKINEFFFADIFTANIDGSDEQQRTHSLVNLSPAWSRVPTTELPTPTITDKPASTIAATSTSFSFTAASGGTFECSLELSSAADDYAACTSPFASGTLSEGTYVFKVRVTDGVTFGTAASHTFTVDTTGPVAEAFGPALTNDTTPSFTFTFNEATASGSVKCSVGPAPGTEPATDCSSPFTPSALTDGDYVFKVKADDVVNNAGTADSHAFTVDTQAPSVSINGPSATNDNTPQFTFSAPAAQSVDCAVEPAGDAPDFSSCSTPYTVGSSLADGDYEFTVAAMDAATNRNEVTHGFTVDTVGPTTTIEGSSLTNDRTPTFDLSFNETPAAGSVKCSVALAPGTDPASDCSDPFTASTLADGDYVLKVKANDALGNTGPTATFAFEVDATGPVATVNEGPVLTNDTSPTFSYSFDEATAAGSVKCSVTLEGAADSYADCSSGAHTPTGLADGDYVFKVKANDGLGNVGGPASHAFTIDTVAPAVDIDGSALTNDRTPSFTFTSPDATSFACSLKPEGQTASFSACTSAYTHGTNLADGDYEFKVQGTDGATNVGETMFTFTVDATGPVASIDGDDHTSDTTPSVTFSFDEATQDGTVECAVDDGAFAACTSPFETGLLAEGEHTIKVRATDMLGNAGAAGTHVVDVDLTGPVITFDANNPVKTRDKTPTFRFTANEAATFTCQIDRKTAVSCGSPYTAKKQKVGKHTLSVIATDSVGNVGAKATFAFKVLR